MKDLKQIYIIGLGFVGYPLYIYLKFLINKKNLKKTTVFGIEKSKKKSKSLEKKITEGSAVIKSNDFFFKKLIKHKSLKYNKIFHSVPKNSSGIFLICINFDGPKDYKNLKNLVINLGKNIIENSTIIFESTLIPGTCEKIIYPTLIKELSKRRIDINKIYFGFSYERIMPGGDYINSIINNFKSVSAINKKSLIKVKNFYNFLINTKKYPLKIFNKIIECETAKVLENTYRAVNIAFIDEWTKFAFKAKINLNDIIFSIKKRKSHSNIMLPGIGVGGYCLTKDPLFAQYACKNILKIKNNFEFSTMAVKINKLMPNFSKDFIISKILNKAEKKHLLIVGYTYKNDVSDERLSPSLVLKNKLFNKFKKISLIDPLINYEHFQKNFDKISNNATTIIFCVNHSIIKKINFNFSNKKKLIFDLSYCLTQKQKIEIKKNKYNRFFEIGNFT